MNKKALISICSSQKSANNDKIEVITPGSYYKEDGSYLAIYNETEISGMEGTTTTLKIYDDKLSLVREGTTNAFMEFSKNNKHTSLYNTPYGDLEIVVNTLDMDINVGDEGGDVFINYNLSISGQMAEPTELKINIKAQ
ncbi:DUF1934 domain-containing protein [Clostridium sp. 19966]|uniref:DUF1934 domain-containing protein n=1 Tax=Clostridium sp. 19966 TaxID=2768166 RepID=UPI0028DFDFCC|nr:DUF1934 domain-containing protein [Clostridium sp. 19966]MDT8715608.1 DUF1934 domain-containing protein [Clostridium sp. 19966]